MTYLQKRFVLSPRGAKDLRKGILYSTLLNITLMLPASYLFLYLMEKLGGWEGSAHGLLFYLIVALLLFAVIFFVSRKQYDSTYTTVYTDSAQRRIRLAEKLRKLPLSFFGKHNLSDLTGTIMEDCTMLETVFSHAIPQLFASVLSMLIIAISLFLFDWRLAASLFWVVPLSLLILLLARRANINRAFGEVYCTKRKVSEQIQQGLESIQEIKAYNGSEEYLGKFRHSLRDLERSLISHELLSGVFMNLSMIFLKLGIPSLLLYGSRMLMQGEITLFVFLAFLIVSAFVYNPLEEVLSNILILTFLDVRLNRVKKMEAMPEQGGAEELHLQHYDIRFDHVDFSYEDGKQVLTDVSFFAPQGKVTALVGASGGGKSTAVKLAARFWDIQAGTITLGGQDISQIAPETLLQNYSMVFQDVLLFNASIADNIRLGKRDATDEEVRRAARMAQCEEIVNRMPQGYDTLIGENGQRLSGGERQRISIARALLKNAPVLLLDEATASLDAENETKVQAALSELVRQRTVLLIAHRMRTILHADHVVVLREGRVIEQGTPDELLAKGGEFARMVEHQQTNPSPLV